MTILNFKLKRFRSNRLALRITFLKDLSCLLALFIVAVSSWVAAEESQNRIEPGTNRQPNKHAEILSPASERHMVDLESMQLPQHRECTTGGGGEGGSGDKLKKSASPNLQFTGQQADLFGCLIAVQEVHEGWIANRNLLIDVRRSERFSMYRIAGSLNLPAFSIKSKSRHSTRSPLTAPEVVVAAPVALP